MIARPAGKIALPSRAGLQQEPDALIGAKGGASLSRTETTSVSSDNLVETVAPRAWAHFERYAQHIPRASKVSQCGYDCVRENQGLSGCLPHQRVNRPQARLVPHHILRRLSFKASEQQPCTWGLKPENETHTGGAESAGSIIEEQWRGRIADTCTLIQLQLKTASRRSTLLDMLPRRPTRSRLAPS